VKNKRKIRGVEAKMQLQMFNINLKLLGILIFSSLLLGISATYFGFLTIGLVMVPLLVIALYKLQLNSHTAQILITLLIYVNLFRPINGFKYISLTVDGIIIFFIIKHIISNGINKGKFFFVFLLTSFIVLSFTQITNPNIPSFAAGLEGFRKTCFSFILFYIGLFSFRDKLEIRRFLIFLSIISIPILLYGIKQYLYFTNFDTTFLNDNVAISYTGEFFGKHRATSIFAGPFHFAMFSSVFTLINLWLIGVVEKRKHKLIFFILFLTSIMACYSSLVRTNLIALSVALICYFTLLQMKKTLFLVPYLSIGFVLLINKITNNIDSLAHSDNELLRFIGTVANFGNDSRLLGRMEGWQTILYLIKQHPFVAYGTGSAGDTLDRVYDFQYHSTSHNFFLKIFMETGLIGFLLIVTLFIGVIFTIFKKIAIEKTNNYNKKLYAICFAVFGVFLVSTTTGSAIEAYPSSGLIMLMLGISLNKFKTDDESIPRKSSTYIQNGNGNFQKRMNAMT
jgi:O-antigen ligase